MSAHTDRRLSTDVRRVAKWLLPNVAIVLKWMMVGFLIGCWKFVKLSIVVGCAVLFIMLTGMSGYEPIKQKANGDG